jgi:oligopeptide/dipeptide ABC transporter ATP-binding protein
MTPRPTPERDAGAGPVPDAPPAVVELDRVSKRFPVRGGVLRRVRRHVHAVSDVSLSVAPGETVGLVGESGSGKSTLGRLALRLVQPDAGTVRLQGTDITTAPRNRVRAMRRHAQMVFQDPYSAFDPLLPVGASVAEPLDVHLRLGGPARTERLHELVGQVGLTPAHLDRYPRELSGGQLQRLAIARALAVAPALVVLDEPVSSLDVSTQAQVINLLEDLQRQTGVAFLFIAHNPALVHHASDRIAVMYLGEIVEIGTASAVYERPRHPYTQALLSAAAVPDPESSRARRRLLLQGDIPDPTEPPSGCRFHTRCPVVMARCATEVPAAVTTADGSVVRCHLVTGEADVVGAAATATVGRNGSRDGGSGG